MADTRDEDAKELSKAYQRVEEHSAAFYQAMEAAVPLFIAFVEARKERERLKQDFKAKHLGLKLQSTKTE